MMSTYINHLPGLEGFKTTHDLADTHFCSKLFLENEYDIKQYFTPFLKYFGIKHVLMTIKNTKAHAPVDQVHQVILNFLVTKDLSNKVFGYMDT